MRLLGRVVALKLVELAAGGSWNGAAPLLDIPNNPAGSAVQKLWRWAVRHDVSLTRFDAGAEAIARRLDDQPVKTDYGRRRARLATWSLPPADWHDLTDDLLYRHRWAGPAHWTEQKRLIALVLVWARVTQGDYLFAPIVLDDKQHNPGKHHFVEQISLFITPRNQRGTTRALNQRLERYADALAGVIDRRARRTGPDRS